ncbi:MAG: helix-turn-helix domain-containing protein [Candidatus Limnocylindria bacterium]|nr:helix-turn-helix domain-containing protein [Candidatus Limnocylindria bacterium]
MSAVYEVDGATEARREAERIREEVARALADDEVSAGVAGPKRGASGAHFALMQAQHALVLGRGINGPGRTTHFDELGPYCFVLNQPAHEVREFAERILGDLIADERNAELVDTLEAYLRLHGNLNSVARHLFLHRNTVRHRLRRIAKLTGADLKDPDKRLAMQLAILGQRALAQVAS